MAPIKVSRHPSLKQYIPSFMLDAIPYFSLIMLPGMIIRAEKRVKLMIRVEIYLDTREGEPVIYVIDDS